MRNVTSCRLNVRGIQSGSLGAVVVLTIALAGCEGGCRKNQPAKQADSSAKAAAAPTNLSAAEPSVRPTPVPASPLAKEDARVEQIHRDLVKVWDALPAFSADVETSMTQALDGPGSTRGLGHYDLQKNSDGGPRIRYSMRNGMFFKAKGEDLFTGELLLWIADGTYLYQHTQQVKVNRVEKRRYDPSFILQVGGRDLLDRLREETVLNLREETKFEGREAYVLEAIAKDGGDKSVHTFDKVTGTRLLWEEFDGAGKTILTVKLFNLSVTPEFPPDHFTFQIPEGARVNDETD